MFFFWRKKPTFGEVALRVLDLKKLRSPKTQANARFQIARLIRNFGPLPVREVTDETWLAYVSRERAVRERTFFDDRKYMRMILARAALANNMQIIKWELPIPDVPSGAGREITAKELRRLRKHAGPTLRFQIEIARRTGLRLREMMRLRWEQVDFAAGVIRLNPADTKMRRGRVVPVPPDLLRQFRARMPAHTALYVFPARGNPQRPQDDNKTAWATCKRKAGVTSARWHDWRHTCATAIARLGGKDAEAGRRMLGMSRKTFSRYTHFSDEDLRAVGSRL